MTECPGSRWSFVTSASTFGGFAGVLAGFVFAGMVFLLSQERPSPLRIRALSLFLSGFVVLGLSTYAYASISGENVAAGLCYHIRTASTIATGMLGVGGVTAVTGVAWLLAASLRRATADDELERAAATLDCLSRVAVYSSTGIVLVLLTVVELAYVKVTLGSRSPVWLPLLVAAVYLFAAAATIFVLRWKIRKANTDYLHSKALRVGIFGAVIWATIGTAIVGILGLIPLDEWRPMPLWVAMFIVAVTLLVPTLPLIALASSAPSLPKPPSTPLLPSSRGASPKPDAPKSWQTPPATQSDTPNDGSRS